MGNPFRFISKNKVAKGSVDVYSPAIFTSRPTAQITEQDALKIPTVKSAVELISNSIAQLPIYLYKENYDGAINSITDERLSKLNESANEYDTAQVIKKKLVKDYLLFGKAYLMNRYDNLYYLDASNMKENIYTEDNITIAKKEFIYNGYSMLTLEEHEVIVFDSGTNGVLVDCEKLFNTALANLNYQSSLLSNSALPIGILKASSKLTETAIARLRHGFEHLYRGVNKAGSTLVLEEGLDYQPISISPEKMQMVDSTKQIISEIAKVFNIPISMLDSSANKYNSIEQNNITFLQSCLSPIITSLENSLDKNLLNHSEKSNGYYFRFSTEELLRTTEKEKIENITMQYNEGLISFNEMRRKLDLTKVDRDYWKYSIGNVLKFEDGKMDNLNLLAKSYTRF